MINIQNLEKTFTLDVLFVVMFNLSLFLLGIVALEGGLAPIGIFMLMTLLGTLFIVTFSKKEMFLKLKIFVFFFSLYVAYVLINHYVLVSLSPNVLPYNYFDEETFYYFSNLGLPYVSGERDFFKLFSMYEVFEIHALPLHVAFSSLMAHFSISIDGSNTIIIQKLLSPFFGGLFSVVLYSTLKYHFKDFSFTLKATFVYMLFSAVFAYSTAMLRDIDVAVMYMIFIYIFLQKNSALNFLLLFLVAFLTIYLRVESGLVLFGLTMIYGYFYVRTFESKSIKLIFYIILIGLISFVLLLMSHKILGMITGLNEANTERAIAESSVNSISLLFNKLPFPLSYLAKVFFGQMQPFPFLLAIDRPLEAISGIFWPFIFVMMLYAVIKKEIRTLIDPKVIYLFIVAISILFLMSSEPMARRMMSVYPIIYIVSLYTFQIVHKNKVIRFFYYYIFGIISLNVFYYLIKI